MVWYSAIDGTRDRGCKVCIWAIKNKWVALGKTTGNSNEGLGLDLNSNVNHKKYSIWSRLEVTFETKVMARMSLSLFSHEVMKSGIRSLMVRKGKWDGRGVEKKSTGHIFWLERGYDVDINASEPLSLTYVRILVLWTEMEQLGNWYGENLPSPTGWVKFKSLWMHQVFL